MSGHLPEGWAKARIEDVLEPLDDGSIIHQGWSPQCERIPTQSEEEWGVLKTTAVQDGAFIPTENKRLPDHFAPRPKLEVKEGDLLITCAGPRVRCGVPCLVRKTRKNLMISGKIYRFRVPTGLLSNCYIEALLRAPSTQNKIEHMKTGISESGLNLTHARFRSLEIPIAPTNEQNRIVEKIEALMARSGRAKEALDAIPALLDRYRQSVLAAAFRGDLTADWRTRHPDTEPASELLKRVRVERRREWERAETDKAKARGKAAPGAGRLARYPEPCEVTETSAIRLPETWSWATVDTLTTRAQYGSSAKANRGPEGLPVLRMGNIVDGELDYADLRYLPNDHAEFPELLLQPGDLLFNRTNSAELVGKTAVYDGAVRPCSFASYLIRLKPVGVLPGFLCGFINSPYGRAWVANVVSQQVGQANVNGTKLKALAVPVPPADEQEVIVARLRDAARMIRVLRGRHGDSVQGLSTLNQSILAKAFRGELVPQDPNDEPASELLARIKADRAATGTPTRRGRRQRPDINTKAMV